MGVKRIEVCHPNHILTKMTLEQMKTAAEKGAYISFYCAGFAPEHWSWDEIIQAIKIVGSEHIILGTDCGNFEFPSPVEAMRLIITGILTRGIHDMDVEKMIKSNPSRLLY